MEENLRQQQTDIIKIALFGPESTGKTTLSQQLAEHFHTVWIPEFAREYLQTKLEKFGEVCEPEDMLPIAIGQTKLENDILSIANKFLFCDTNLMVTKVYSEAYYNFCDPILDQAAKNHTYDLFFLTDIDMPWEKDDLRDSVENRDKFFDIFYNSLIENKKPFIKLSGSKENRLKKAIFIVNNLVKAKEMGFSSDDFVQIYNQQITLENIDFQKKNFENGVSKTFLERPAIINDGILAFSESEFSEKSKFFDTKKGDFKLMKFVPASGAASRMFKFLNEFLNDFDFNNESINSYINRKNANDLTVFLAGLEKFPFFQKVDKFLNATFSDFKLWDSDIKNHQFIEFLILDKDFDYVNKPKAILPFHKYKNHIATPIEEHLNESACYATSNNISNLHFTVSENHQKQFEEILFHTKPKIEKEFGSKIEVNFSYQKTSTDTLAVDLKNKPLRNQNGNLTFRPGGHGALLENLNDLDADLVFVKNIDNVIQNHIEKIAFYKKGLAGILLELQYQIFGFLNQIENHSIQESDIQKIVDFASKKLNIEIINGFEKFTFENKISYIIEILNRPIRVCGMVKNEGEPGGGPFWVRDQKGIISLQIVETAQVDVTNLNQAQILKNSTHFNPVDLVCGIKNHKKQKFNLHDFVDHKSGFIVEKNKNGIDYKAYELPGLWNGAMAKWITIFVQVPLITFNPVKTVNDLLKPAHQPNYTNFG
jgi:nicotinamide riboside kinase